LRLAKIVFLNIPAYGRVNPTQAYLEQDIGAYRYLEQSLRMAAVSNCLSHRANDSDPRKGTQ
jgi:hypothetical protein